MSAPRSAALDAMESELLFAVRTDVHDDRERLMSFVNTRLAMGSPPLDIAVEVEQVTRRSTIEGAIVRHDGRAYRVLLARDPSLDEDR